MYPPFTDFQFWFIIIIQLIGFLVICLKVYAKSYSTEKGKNLATKEDIGGITQIIESIKTSLAKETEELKSDLSYKNEHLIHLRSAERTAIINYYKATWVLVLNFKRPDLIKNQIDHFDKKKKQKISAQDLRRYILEAELVLNGLKEEISTLKYQRDISESELLFFYHDSELNSIINEFNLSLFEFEKHFISTIDSLLQVFTEAIVKFSSEKLPEETITEIQILRSEILMTWYENRSNSLSFIRTFNENLKRVLHTRLNSL